MGKDSKSEKKKGLSQEFRIGDSTAKEYFKHYGTLAELLKPWLSDHVPLGSWVHWMNADMLENIVVNDSDVRKAAEAARYGDPKKVEELSVLIQKCFTQKYLPIIIKKWLNIREDVVLYFAAMADANSWDDRIKLFKDRWKDQGFPERTVEPENVTKFRHC